MNGCSASGLVFEFQAVSPAAAPVCCVHLSFDKSVEKHHAIVKYNPTISKFEIRALSSSSASSPEEEKEKKGSDRDDSLPRLFLNGNAITASHGFIPLNHGTVVQLGRRTYLFLLPVSGAGAGGQLSLAGLGKKDNPLVLRRNVLRCLIESIKLRNGVQTEHHLGSDLKIQRLEALETQTILGVSLHNKGETITPAAGSLGGGGSGHSSGSGSGANQQQQLLQQSLAASSSSTSAVSQQQTQNQQTIGGKTIQSNNPNPKRTTLPIAALPRVKEEGEEEQEDNQDEYDNEGEEGTEPEQEEAGDEEEEEDEEEEDQMIID
jgi:hypothetical protein